MDEFSKKHADDVHCVLSVFDRVLIKGYLPISSAGGMESFMSSEGVLIKDFGRLSSGYADVLKEHARRSEYRATGDVLAEEKHQLTFSTRREGAGGRPWQELTWL